MQISAGVQVATEFVEYAHETTRLYLDNRIAWGRRVGMFNRNARIRERLVDVPKQYFGEVIFRSPTPESFGSMAKLLSQRKSTRIFSSEAIPLSLIGDLFSQAIMASDDKNTRLGLSTGRRRAYGSAGAIYAVEHYLVGLNVERFEYPFIAYCSPQHREIIVVNRGRDRTSFLEALGIENESIPAFAIVQTLDLERATRKYQERGYRFGMIEAGLAAQTLCLVATTLNLGSVMWGGHYDHLIDKLLKISGTNETAINTIFFGVSFDDRR